MNNDKNKNLSEFGSGDDSDDLSGIQKIEQNLCLWIIEQENTKVFTRKQEKYSNGYFKLDGKYRPNLFVNSNDNNYIINVVSAEESSDVHDAVIKTIDYWKDITLHERKVNYHQKSAGIDAVLLATEYSLYGHLYNNRNKNDPLREQRSEEGKETAQYHNIPKIEHTCSETLIRLMWRFAEDKNGDAKIGLGGLLSSQLDADDPTSTDADEQDTIPAALYKIPNSNSNQEWDYIPKYMHQY